MSLSSHHSYIQDYLLDFAKENPVNSNIYCFINRDKKVIQNADPQKTLLEYLRETGYYGTKYGCGEGGCGACTVVIADYDHAKDMIRYRTANACILPLCSIHLKQVITVEGIGNPENPHPVQERIAKGNGSQCGFCTPGIVMSLFGFLKLDASPSMVEIEESFDGNLCRCTGYRPILEAAKSFSKDYISETMNSEININSNSEKIKSCNKLVDFTQFKAYDPNADLPFPGKLKEKRLDKCLFIVYENRYAWIEPKNLNELLKIKHAFPNVKIVNGSSEIAIEIKLRGIDYLTFVNASNLNEIKSLNIRKTCENGKSYLDIGINITLTELIDSLKELKKNFKTNNSHYNSLINSLLIQLRWFASRQIRNFASLAGNVATASPISDLNPIFLATNAYVTVASHGNCEREIFMRKFILGYRRVDLKPDEVLTKLSIPLPENSFEIIRAYKQSKRKDDDIATVNGAFKVKLSNEDGYFKIVDLDLSYGGLAPVTIYLERIAQAAKGLIWSNSDHLTLIENMILEEINFSYSVPGGMPTYRRTLAVSFFKRFWYQVIRDLNIPCNESNLLYNLDDIERDLTRSTQVFGPSISDPYIGITLPHLSSINQTTGVAKYVDDFPKVNNELHGSLVFSTNAHAYIKSIDASKALELKGVHAFVTYKDVPFDNIFGIIHDEELFASKEVLCYGQIIGMILADNKTLAKRAAALVQVDYEPLDCILTIEDAIKHNSFYDFELFLSKGTINDETFSIKDDNELIFEGSCRLGGQEHFYLETQGCLIIPQGENNEFIIYSATQNPTEVQQDVGRALGIPANRIVCKTKRIGGGFGGKETRSTLVSVVAAIAAYKVNRPVRFTLERDVDMLITGGRHPFLGQYKLKITRDGYFRACQFNFISNGGHSFDLSGAVMERAVMSCDNAYNFPNFSVRGRVAKTNIPSNTAFRGFGSPQGVMVLETMISEVADQIGIDQIKIREQNMYKIMDKTHYNMTIKDWFLPEMLHDLIQNTNYTEIRKEIEDFNLKNVWKKRGASIIPLKYGISFGIKFLNQAGALVHIYTDGSVLLTHGGTEMGQGLHTKMIQIAASTLDVPIDRIFTSEVSTDKVPNASSTAASFSSDLNGMAVYNACKVLYERLKPYRDRNPNGNLKDWANAAYFDQISLSATGFYEAPHLDYDIKTNTGRRFSYFTLGTAMSIVELDVLTGDHTILRSDILIEIGNSINFSIDIGQIEGAFIQGVGWCTIEEILLQTSNGAILTRGPGNYKIPGFRDIPVEFNVKILKDKKYEDLNSIKSSKGIGEPPLVLATSVFFALRDAVIYARKSNGINEPLIGFQLPCTPEILRLACDDGIPKRAVVLPKKKLLQECENNKTEEQLWSIRP